MSGIDWNTEKLTKYLSTSRSLSFVKQVAVALLVVGQARLHRVGDGVEQVVDARALDQVDLPERVQAQALGMRGGGLVEDFHRRALRQFLVQRAQLLHRVRFVLVHVRHSAFRRALDLGHVGDQHRMVRGHRAPAFGDDARRRQPFGLAGLGQRLHDARCVVVDAVVDRVVAAAARAFVVDAKAAADIDMADVRAEPRQFDEVARRLAHAGGDVAHVGNLAAHVEVQQLQAVAHAGVAQRLPQVQQLARVEADSLLSPPLFCHLPAPSEASRMRTPSPGFTPSAAASSSAISSSDGFSMTMKVCMPSLRPISARRMYSRSL
jgi:hypothetical protein